MTITDILEYTPQKLQKLTDRELRKAINQLNSAANKRLSRIESSGLSFASPAYNYIKREYGGRFSVPEAGVSRRTLYETYRDLKEFLTDVETGSVSGTRRNLESLRRVSGLENEEDIKKFFNIYEYVKAEYTVIAYELNYRVVMETIRDYIKSGSDQSWEDYMHGRYSGF